MDIYLCWAIVCISGFLGWRLKGDYDHWQASKAIDTSDILTPNCSETTDVFLTDQSILTFPLGNGKFLIGTEKQYLDRLESLKPKKLRNKPATKKKKAKK